MGYAAEQAYALETALGDDLYPKPRKFIKCPKCGKKMKKIAEEFKKLTWLDMNNFAEHIAEFATDDEGEPNGATYIAQCLLDWADETTDDIT